MKPHLDIVHTGNLGTDDRTAMTFDENAIAHLMSVLTDLYSDPTQAVVREYSTNARDAHVAAGKADVPIEIELPTEWRPTFVIRDRGIGMSADTLRNEFSKYGFSSKRDTNEQTGMLGLGCKSALSLTSQFTMVSIFNGLKITVLITRQEDGAGAVQIVDTCATEEGNGVEIRIPADHRSTDFKDRCDNFFRFWDRGTVLIDGVEPAYIWDHPHVIRIDEDVYLVPEEELHVTESLVVMGGVPYPADFSEIRPYMHFGHYSGGLRIVARVPIGSVNFTPSREALQYTARTKETLSTLAAFVLERTTRKLQDEMDAAPTYMDAYRVQRSFGRVGVLFDGVGYGGLRKIKALTYRGLPIPTYFNFEDPLDPNDPDYDKKYNAEWHNKVLRFPIEKPGRWERDDSSRVSSMTLGDALEGIKLIVEGSKATYVHSAVKEKIRAHCEANGIPAGGGKVLMIPDLRGMSHREWVEGIPVLAYDEVKKMVNPSGPSAPKKPRNQKYWFQIIGYSRQRGSGSLVNPPLDANGDVATTPHCFVSVDDPIINDLGGRERVRTAMQGIIEHPMLAVVATKQMTKWATAYPNVPTLKEWIENAVATAPTNLTDWEAYRIQRLRNDDGLERIFNSQMRADRISDPEFAETLRSWKSYYNKSYDGVNRYHATANLARMIGLEVDPPRSTGIGVRLRKLAKQYPLALHLHSCNNPDAMHEYLNGQYILRYHLHVIPVL